MRESVPNSAQPENCFPDIGWNRSECVVELKFLPQRYPAFLKLAFESFQRVLFPRLRTMSTKRLDGQFISEQVVNKYEFTHYRTAY